MTKRIVLLLLAALVLGGAPLVSAQPTGAYRIGLVHPGGPAAEDIAAGLAEELGKLGQEEGRVYAIDARDLQGSRLTIEDVAGKMEREKVDLICTITASVSIEVKRATSHVPIVFAIGGDPVEAKLVESYAKPGGRITGVQLQQSAGLVAKRLQILKDILPGTHRVVTFYDPGNAIAAASVKAAREAARALGIELMERKVSSVEELRSEFLALKAGEVDAYFYVNDAMVSSQAQFIIDSARTMNLPTMFPWPHTVTLGALVGYGVNSRQAGRLMAKYVQRVLAGTSPMNLPVESLSKVELAVNLKTAQEIGVAIPRTALLRAGEVVR